jgi:molecular chaperone GrpE
MADPQNKAKGGNGAGQAATAAPPESELVSGLADQKVAEMEAQLQDAGQKVLRAQAELENYRKRVQREMADERRYAALPLVRDLLAVLDNLQRAIDAATHGSPHAPREAAVSRSETTTNAGLLEGVKMVANQFETVLKQHGCTPIETVGHPFDPNQHQAIAQEPSDQYPAGTITRAAQIGYKLHDRVVRPAQVFVSTGAPTA